MFEQAYRTPEGFDLYKPLSLPDARSFTDLFPQSRPWDFETMNHRWGRRGPETPDVIERMGYSRVVTRFCSIRGGRSLLVEPSPEVVDLLFSDDFAFFDRISFEAITHEARGRTLVTAHASGILASRWLAYVDTTTVPGLS